MVGALNGNVAVIAGVELFVDGGAAQFEVRPC